MSAYYLRYNLLLNFFVNTFKIFLNHSCYATTLFVLSQLEETFPCSVKYFFPLAIHCNPASLTFVHKPHDEKGIWNCSVSFR